MLIACAKAARRCQIFVRGIALGVLREKPLPATSESGAITITAIRVTVLLSLRGSLAKCVPSGAFALL